jgi:3-hydroxyacyl-CoA dehydrogenase
MKPEDIKNIGIMGGGVMGGGIAQVLAVGGYHLIVRDLTQELLDKTRATIVDGRFGLKAGVQRGKLTDAEMEAALSRIAFTMDVADLRDVDFLIEAIPEDLELKRKVFSELDRTIRPEAIFATNTSGFLSPTSTRRLAQGPFRRNALVQRCRNEAGRGHLLAGDVGRYRRLHRGRRHGRARSPFA